MSEYYKFEDQQELAELAGVNYDMLFCGYLRQPFRVRFDGDITRITGSCAHFDITCERAVGRGDRGYAVETCAGYNKLYKIRRAA